jgi:hypothetical protein
MACTNCGCKNKPCGCEDGPLTTPAPCNPIGCPDPYPCSEVIDAQCVLYSGDPIICGEDTVVDTGDNVADALNQVVDYFCGSIPAQCCPTFYVDISKPQLEIFTLNTTLTNGTAPYTYEWSLEQNAFQGLVFISATNTSTVQMDLNPGSPTPLYQTNIGGQMASSLVKVKVTDANGQIACAYYNAVQLVFS